MHVSLTPSQTQTLVMFNAIPTIRERHVLRPARFRDGFTMLELLLVLAIMVIIASFAVPALRHPLANQRLRKAADTVKIEFGRARVHAIKTGATVAFQIQPATRQSRVTPWTLNQDDNLTDAAAMQNQFNAITRTVELPKGTQFVTCSTDDDRTAFAFQQQSQSNVADDVWSTPILFFPDGTSSRASVVIKNRFDNQITLQLRWLTGMAEAEPIVPSGASSITSPATTSPSTKSRATSNAGGL